MNPARKIFPLLILGPLLAASAVAPDNPDRAWTALADNRPQDVLRQFRPDAPSRADRLAYYRDLVTTMEANGMAWANWEYKGDFGILEWHGINMTTGAPDLELIDALVTGSKEK